MICNGRLFVSLDLSQSRVTLEGVLLEEYIGKCDFCHSDCHFYSFLEQALQAEPF